MRQESLSRMLLVWLGCATALTPATGSAQSSTEVVIPSLREQAVSANFAHAQAADRCDFVEMGIRLRIIESIEREASEQLQAARITARLGGGDESSPAVQLARMDFGEIALIRETMIKRIPDCDRRYRFGLRVIGQYGETYLPRVGLGFSGQQQEFYIVRSARTLDTGWLKTALDTRIRRFQVGFWTQFGWANNSTSFDLPATNQTQFGAVYTAPSPSGTSGVQLQLFGVRGTTTVRLREEQVGVRVPFKVAENETPRPTDRVFFGYSYFGRTERLYTGRLGMEASFLNNTLFFDQERRQKLGENHFGAGVGGRVEHSPGAGWSFELAAQAGAYYRDSSLESVETVRSNVVPAADQSFTQVVEDDDKGVGFDGEVEFGVERALTPRFSVYAGGAAGYRSEVGGVFNPSSSEQLLTEGLTTHIETGDMWWWRVGGGVTIRFGTNADR